MNEYTPGEAMQAWLNPTPEQVPPEEIEVLEEDEAREEFHAQRRKGIGGSDAAAIFGVSTYKSRFSLYHEKVNGLRDTAESEYAYWGRQIEPLVRARYAEITKREIGGPEKYLVHPDHDFMVANTDGTVEAEGRDGTGTLEIKCSNAFMAKDWDETVPLDYQIQLQHYLLVTGRSWGSFGVLIGGNTFRWVDVEAHEEFQEALLEQEHDFWHKNVLPQVSPPIDGHKATTKALALLHPQDNGQVRTLTTAELDWWNRRVEAKERIKEIEEHVSEYENKLKGAMEDYTFGELPNGHCISYKTTDRRGFSVAATTFRSLRAAAAETVEKVKLALRIQQEQGGA